MKKTLIFGLALACSLPLLTGCDRAEDGSAKPLPVIQPLVDKVTNFFTESETAEEEAETLEVAEEEASTTSEPESAEDSTSDEPSAETEVAEAPATEDTSSELTADTDSVDDESMTESEQGPEEPVKSAAVADAPAEEAPAAEVPVAAVPAAPTTGMQPHAYMPSMPHGSVPMMPPMANNVNPMAMMNPMMAPGMTNPGMMNYGFMNPMNMMGAMNPQYHAMWMQAMAQMAANPTIDGMTQPQNIQAMMMAMNPQMMASMMGGQANPNAEIGEDGVPQQLPLVSIPGFPTQTPQNNPDRTVSGEVSTEAKKNAFQTMMMISPLSMRDMLGIMTDKMAVAEDVSWEDAVDSMKLRANEKNFKFVGSNPLYKQVEAMTGEPTGKVEIFQFCDALVADKIIAEVPEFIVFLPCRIALIEDADGKLWVMTMDWDVSWLDFAQNQNSHLGKELRADATRIRETLRYIMEGAATGDF